MTLWLNKLFLTLFILTAFFSSALAGRLPEPVAVYSATTVTQFEGRVITGKVYHAPYKERREQDFVGKRQIIITRMDLRVVWILFPDQKTYTEEPVGEAFARSGDPSDLDYKYTEIGPDLVNGITTIKSRIVATDKDGMVHEGYMWVTGEGILLKMESIVKGRAGTYFKTELHNLRIANQPKSLFEVPAGYTKMGGPGGFSLPVPPMK